MPCRHLMDGQFELMRQERVAAPEEALALAHVEAGSTLVAVGGGDVASPVAVSIATKLIHFFFSLLCM